MLGSDLELGSLSSTPQRLISLLTLDQGLSCDPGGKHGLRRPPSARRGDIIGPSEPYYPGASRAYCCWSAWLGRPLQALMCHELLSDPGSFNSRLAGHLREFPEGQAGPIGGIGQAPQHAAVPEAIEWQEHRHESRGQPTDVPYQ